jgi:hypothetical protein
MNRCPNCGAQNRDGAKFCTSCGFRLPAETPAYVTPDRSPFATTSSVPGSPVSAGETAEPVAESQEFGSTWQPAAEPEVETGPGLSWESSPPRDTSMPVNDEMIAALLEDEESSSDSDVEAGIPQDDYVRVPEVEQDLDSVLSDLSVADATADSDDMDDLDDLAVELDTATTDLSDPHSAQDIAATTMDDPAASAGVMYGDAEPAMAYDAESEGSSAAPSIDSLLRLARELEYGLIELADSAGRTPVASSGSDVDVRLLANALNDLQSDDELANLRESISKAQDRPRDVDVMLELVLRADAIASVLTERDQLKHAIELAIGGSSARGGEPGADVDTGDGIDY